MKALLKENAIQLRKAGLSVNKIAFQLGVSTSSISLWTKDVILTEEQKENLISGALNGRTLAHSIFFENQRISFQKKGKDRINTEDSLYLAGCMLYWGNGSKDKNSVRMTNSDPAMLIVFKNFLLRFFNVKNEDIILSITCYTNIKSLTEIEEYWLKVLDLPRSNLRKSQTNNIPKSSKGLKIGKLEWGTACIMVHRTDIVQEIFGAIQEYGGFIKNEWVK